MLKLLTKKLKIFQQTRNICTQIDDLNKVEKSGEDILRCKLASTYLLVDLKGWSWSIYNHITVSKYFQFQY